MPRIRFASGSDNNGENMIPKLVVVLLSLALFGTGSAAQTHSAAQTQAPEPIIQSGGKIVTLVWGGLTWHIPQRFFFGVRTWTENKIENPKELWIQFGWNKQYDNFRPADMRGYDIVLDVHVRKVDSEDPRSGLELIHRIHLPFTQVPIFSSAKFSGMTYLGSSSSFHYFRLNNQDAYVTCWLIMAAKLKPPKVPPDVLSRKFTCDTVFFFPHKTYVRVSMWGVDISEAAPAFDAAYRLILSFIR